MPTADTSWLLRLLNQDDPRHATAREAARGLANIILPSLVLTEVLQVTEFDIRKRSGARLGKAAAREVYRALTENPAFEVITEYDKELAHALYTASVDLSYVDAAAVAVAHARKTELLSFDGDQIDAWHKLERASRA